jgi:ribulose-phosphate 3-epimerase
MKHAPRKFRAARRSRAKAIKIAPSILSADFAKLADELAEIEAGGADWVHVDVMDGRFVPNITIGPLVVEAVRRSTSLPLDVHLMIVEPERYVNDFVRAGANTVGVHVETCSHLHRSLTQIREAGARASVVLNPATPAVSVENVLGDVDQVLVMTVNPGFGGQKFIASMLDKIATLRRWIDERGLDVALEVDGGIGPETIAAAARAGADVFVAGNAVFGAPDRAEAISALRKAAAPSRLQRPAEAR